MHNRAAIGLGSPDCIGRPRLVKRSSQPCLRDQLTANGWRSNDHCKHDPRARREIQPDNVRAANGKQQSSLLQNNHSPSDTCAPGKSARSATRSFRILPSCLLCGAGHSCTSLWPGPETQLGLLPALSRPRSCAHRSAVQSLVIDGDATHY